MDISTNFKRQSGALLAMDICYTDIKRVLFAVV